MKRKLKRSDIVMRLSEIAFGRSNDAVRLAFFDPDDMFGGIDALDLTMLSDLRRSSAGGIEIKLYNRFEALRLLLEAVGHEGEERSGAEKFFEAMDAAAKSDQEQM